MSTITHRRRTFSPIMARTFTRRVKRVRTRTTTSQIRIRRTRRPRYLNTTLSFSRLPFVRQHIRTTKRTLNHSPHQQTKPPTVSIRVGFFANRTQHGAPTLRRVNRILTTSPTLMPAINHTQHTFPTTTTLRRGAFRTRIRHIRHSTFNNQTRFRQPHTSRIVTLRRLVSNSVRHQGLHQISIRRQIQQIFINRHNQIKDKRLRMLRVSHGQHNFHIKSHHTTLRLLTIRLRHPRQQLTIRLRQNLVRHNTSTTRLTCLRVHTTRRLLNTAAQVLTNMFVNRNLPQPSIRFKRRATSTRTFAHQRRNVTNARRRFAAAINGVTQQQDRNRVHRVTVHRPVAPLQPLRNRTRRHITPSVNNRTRQHQRVSHSTLRVKTSSRLTINTVRIRLRLVERNTKS